MALRYETPDIYFERTHAQERLKPLEKVKVNIGAFIGFTDRGPVQKPVLVNSWKAFQDIFGGTSRRYQLGHAVYGFFVNGGESCYVVRVARMGDDPQAARRAELHVPDYYGRPTLLVGARDHGTSGNEIKVTVSVPVNAPRTLLRADLEAGDTEAPVEVTRDFEAGGVCRIADGTGREEFVTLTDVSRRRFRWEDPLTEDWEAVKTTYIEAVQFKLLVSSGDHFEIHDHLNLTPQSKHYVERVVAANSRLVDVEDLRSSSPAPRNHPKPAPEVALAGGRDGVTGVSATDFMGWSRSPGNRGGILSFEDVEEIGLIAIPDLHTAASLSTEFRGEEDVEAVQQALVDYCEREKTCFAILDPPPGLAPDQVREWRNRFDTKYAAVYYPWLKVLTNPDRGRRGGATRMVPPSGYVMGLTARTDEQHGVHKAPANEVLNDVVGLERTLEKDSMDALAPEGVNCLRAFPGRGLRVWGARTLSSDTLWQHINVRRLFIMIERSIAEGSEWVVFENNNWSTWKSVERLVSSFLTHMWKEGALVGEVPEEAYFVRCDESTNPPEARDAGEFVCEVGLAAVRPAEFIVFRIGQRTKDIIMEEPVS